MEPERKIEKLLRAYAKKRRADSGDALKLHPATRNLLHGEVARRTPKQSAEDSSLTIWELFRQQWALLLGFVARNFLRCDVVVATIEQRETQGAKYQRGE